MKKKRKSVFFLIIFRDKNTWKLLVKHQRHLLDCFSSFRIKSWFVHDTHTVGNVVNPPLCTINTIEVAFFSMTVISTHFLSAWAALCLNVQLMMYDSKHIKQHFALRRKKILSLDWELLVMLVQRSSTCNLWLENWWISHIFLFSTQLHEEQRHSESCRPENTHYTTTTLSRISCFSKVITIVGVHSAVKDTFLHIYFHFFF